MCALSVREEEARHPHQLFTRLNPPHPRRAATAAVALRLVWRAAPGRPGSEQVKIYRRINVVIHQKCTKSELLDHKTGLNRFKPVWATV